MLEVSVRREVRRRAFIVDWSENNLAFLLSILHLVHWKKA